VLDKLPSGSIQLSEKVLLALIHTGSGSIFFWARTLCIKLTHTAEILLANPWVLPPKKNDKNFYVSWYTLPLLD